MVEIDLISVWGRNLTWLQCRDRNWLDFCVDHRSWIVLVYGSKLTFFFLYRRSEIDLIPEWGSKFIWFQWWDLNWLGICARDRNWLIFTVQVEMLDFKVWIDVDMIIVCRPEIPELYCEHGNWLGFCVGGRNCLASSVGDGTWFGLSVGMKLFWLLCGVSKLTWFYCWDRNGHGVCLTVDND